MALTGIGRFVHGFDPRASRVELHPRGDGAIEVRGDGRSLGALRRVPEGFLLTDPIGAEVAIVADEDAALETLRNTTQGGETGLLGYASATQSGKGRLAFREYVRDELGRFAPVYNGTELSDAYLAAEGGDTVVIEDKPGVPEGAEGALRDLANDELGFDTDDGSFETYLVEECGFPLDELAQITDPVMGRPLSMELQADYLTYPNGFDAPAHPSGFSMSFYSGEDFVGTVQRNFVERDGELWVYNSGFRLVDEAQGQGLGTEINGALEGWYTDAGVTGMRLEANIDVGGYAWAKAGYDWDPTLMKPRDVDDLLSQAYGWSPQEDDEADSIRARLSSRTTHQWHSIDSPDFPMPADIAMIGWEPGAEMWAGKGALLGSSWHGEKRL